MADERKVKTGLDEIKEKLFELDEQRSQLLLDEIPKVGIKPRSFVDADNIHSGHHRGALEVFLEYQEITDRMDELRIELLSFVDAFETIQDKVIFLVNVYGMKQEEAADYLGYSHGYIRNICYSVRKSIETCDN